jgi:hypothetical protein
MIDLQEVTLDIATASSAPILANLLELYVHDLSGVFAIDIGADGRFGYDRLPLYWSQPDTHFAFFVRVGGRLAGFVLATAVLPPPTIPRISMWPSSSSCGCTAAPESAAGPRFCCGTPFQGTGWCG